MDLTQLKAFLAVTEAGGFAAAADTMDVAPSTITRAVANLEASLGVRLFQRTTRSVVLTEAGQHFLNRVSPALDELDAAADLARQRNMELSGTLRVSASVSFGQYVIAPNLHRFAAEHPNLNVDLALSDEVTDLIADRIDIAVRHGDLADSSLIARRLARVSYRCVASACYVEKSEPITHPKDVARHACLSFPYPAYRSRWRFKTGRKVQEVEIDPQIRVSNAAALMSCVKADMGLALLADWIVDPDIKVGSLVNVLPEWTASGVGMDNGAALWMVTPSRAFVPAKSKAFGDFLRRTVSELAA